MDNGMKPAISLMRIFSYILMIAGLCLLGIAAYQEWNGITTRPILGSRAGGVPGPKHIDKAIDPEHFRSAMAAHWIAASATTFLGVALMLIIRGQDRTDPLARDIDGEDEDDDVKS